MDGPRRSAPVPAPQRVKRAEAIEWHRSSVLARASAPFTGIAVAVGRRYRPGEANAQHGEANAQHGEANTQPGEANTQPGEANTQPGEANAQPGEANAQH